MEQARGIEPQSPAWKAGILAVVRRLHITGATLPVGESQQPVSPH